MSRRRDHHLIIRNPPPGWGWLFGPVPGPRSCKTRCLLCGSTGYGPHGDVRTYTGDLLTPAPWQVRCILGHPVQCITCRRPFTGPSAVAGHQSCKLHHACCLDHTTVPEWKNPFRQVVAA